MLQDAVTDRFIPVRSQHRLFNSADKSDQATNYSRIISPAKFRCLKFASKSHSTNETLSQFIANSCRKKHLHKSKLVRKAVKILDAPDLVDNYYYSPIDWSTRDIIGVALDNSVFLLKKTNIYEIQRYSSIPVSCIKIINEGTLCLFGEETGRVEVYDVQKNSRLRTINSHYDRVGSICPSGQGLFFSGSKDKIIKFNDLRLKKSDIFSWEKHRGQICGMSVLNQYLASGGNDNRVIIWDIRNSYPIIQLKKHASAVKAITWCPWKSNLLATGGGYKDGKIVFWNGNTQQTENIIQTQCQVSSLIARKDKKQIIAANSKINKSVVTVWDTSANIIDSKMKLKGHSGRIAGMAINPDNPDNICTVSADQTLRIWDISTEISPQLQQTNIYSQSELGCLDVR